MGTLNDNIEDLFLNTLLVGMGLIFTVFIILHLEFWFLDAVGFTESQILWNKFWSSGFRSWGTPWSWSTERAFNYMTLNWNLAVLISFAISLSITCTAAYALLISCKHEKDTLRNSHRTKNLTKSGTKRKGIYAGSFGGNRLYVKYSDRGLVVGPPGTGKTALIINQILKSAENRLSFVALDSKPEIHELTQKALEQKGYKVIALAPSCIENHYNPLCDIKDDIDIGELVTNILPIEEHAQTTAFVDCKRDYLKSAIFHLESEPADASLPAAYNLLSRFDNAEKYINTIMLSSNKIARKMAKRLKAGLKAERLVRQGFSSVQRDLEFLAYDSVAETLRFSDFSLNDLGKNRPIALFLKFPEEHFGVMGPLISVFYGHIFNILIKNHANRKPVALFFDEIGNVPLVTNLPQKLNTIRSRNIPTWLYWQSIAQMQRYGVGADQTISGACSLKMFFRSDDIATQREVSALCGTTTNCDQESYSRRSDGHTTSTISEKERNLIEPHDVGELENQEIIVLYKGKKARGKAVPYFVDYPFYFNSRKN